MTEDVQALREGQIAFGSSGLCRVGAAAAVVAALLFRRNMDAEWTLLRQIGIINRGPSVAPGAVDGWFALLQEHRLLGLTMLNLFDLVNYALVGVMLLALIDVLRRANPSWVLVAGGLGFAGIASYFATNQVFAMLSLSNQYAAATGETQRATLLAAGQAVLAIHQGNSFAGAGIHISFLCVSLAGLIGAAVMLRSDDFSRSTAWMGLLANAFGLGYYVALVLAPELVFVPLSVSAVFLLIWYLQIGTRLWALGSRRISHAVRVVAGGA